MVDLFQEAVGYSDLQRLDLSHNKLGNEGIKVVACALMFRSQLKYLNVANCDFNIEGGYSFLGTLGKNHTVEQCIIDNNDLKGPKQRQKVLKDILMNNKTLKSLSLNNCNIGEAGMHLMTLSIGISPSLVSLSLAGNKIGDNGVENLINAFVLDCFIIENISFADNKLTDKGGAYLARAFMCCKSLQTIDLRHNDLSEKTGILLKPVCKVNHCLIKINLEYNICKRLVIEELNKLTKLNEPKLDKHRTHIVRRKARALRSQHQSVRFKQN